MRVPNLHTGQSKLELFLRKSILIWKNMNWQDVLKGLDSTKFLEILKFCTAIKNLTNFRTANLKLLLSIQILCASYFKFV